MQLASLARKEGRRRRNEEGRKRNEKRRKKNEKGGGEKKLTANCWILTGILNSGLSSKMMASLLLVFYRYRRTALIYDSSYIAICDI